MKFTCAFQLITFIAVSVRNDIRVCVCVCVCVYWLFGQHVLQLARPIEVLSIIVAPKRWNFINPFMGGAQQHRSLGWRSPLENLFVLWLGFHNFQSDKKTEKCRWILPGKLAWLAGKSPRLMGDTSSNGWFSIVMLVLRGVTRSIESFFTKTG